MVTINVNEVFRNKVISGYKSAPRYLLTECMCTRYICVISLIRVKKIGAEVTL